MTFHRRMLLKTGIIAGFGIGAAAVVSKPERADAATSAGAANALSSLLAALKPNSPADQSAELQAAIDAASTAGVPIELAPGTYRVHDIRLRSATRLIGCARATTLLFSGGHTFITADKADDLVISGITLDGLYARYDPELGEGLLSIVNSRRITIDDLTVRHSAKSGIAITLSSGRVANTEICDVLDAGLKTLDGHGIDIHGLTVRECGNNGILVWRSERGEDGTTVRGNRVSNIRNLGGGTGEYGNGINVFRAGGVHVSDNRITDCAYSAVRGNAASNIQIIANNCERLGEVAIYSEFGFEGALIANNSVTTAASGISVTNFNEGGRLAVIQGNLIRDLFRREAEPADKRGEGIGVEADAVVSGNTIEGAPTVGIQIGWGPFMRDVAATGNVIRRCKVGISITANADAASCLIANNLISGSSAGAIRAMQLGTLLGPDLATMPNPGNRITVIGNVAV